MILRDRTVSGTLDERLYPTHDANFNVTALVDTAGAVVERYAYAPFGAPSYYDAAWTPLAASGYAWNHLHQGGRLDAVSGLYCFRYRDYSAMLGRWMTNDPKRSGNKYINLYLYVANNPNGYLDFLGLEPSLSFKTVVEESGTSGGYFWGIEWIINKKPDDKCLGIILQHVTISTEGKPRKAQMNYSGYIYDGKKFQKSDNKWPLDRSDYYEFWIVDSKGQVLRPKDGKSKDANEDASTNASNYINAVAGTGKKVYSSLHDAFWYGGDGDVVSGKIKQTGEVWYILQMNKAELYKDNLFITGNGQTGVGPLASADTNAAFADPKYPDIGKNATKNAATIAAIIAKYQAEGKIASNFSRTISVSWADSGKSKIDSIDRKP
jgi:RHS repeat-associated protein